VVDRYCDFDFDDKFYDTPHNKEKILCVDEIFISNIYFNIYVIDHVYWHGRDSKYATLKYVPNSESLQGTYDHHHRHYQCHHRHHYNHLC